MRADRLLYILLVLQAQGRATSKALAERLEVSPRTIHRDMEALTGAGVPVYAERGARGGWRLLDDYRTDLTGLNPEEIKALLIQTPKLLGDLGLSKASEGAFIKLLATLPTLQRQRAEAVRERILVDPRGASEAVPWLPVLLEAVWRGRKLHLTYQRGDGEPYERRVDPLGLVAKGQTWYLVAWNGETYRTYRVSRVQEARLGEEDAAVPEGFNLKAHWERSRAAFKEKLPSYFIRAEVEAAALERFGLVGRWARVEASEPAEEGWLRVRVRFELEADALAWALSLGTAVRVLEPLELRKKLRETARAVYQSL
jgi:predicted DNA-binding transcriptional regulator YafY